jgi:uncharacterized membrane protein YphA (DoxX/SURF4 family)
MPKPLPYLFRFFGIFAGLVTLVAAVALFAPEAFNWLNYGFVLCTFYLAVVLVPLHLLALIFYLGKYLLTNKEQQYLYK